MNDNRNMSKGNDEDSSVALESGLILIAEYSGKARGTAERILDIRFRLSISIALTILFLYIFIPVVIFILDDIVKIFVGEYSFSVSNYFFIIVPAILFSALPIFITITSRTRQLQSMRIELEEYVLILERVLRRTSQIYEHVNMPLTDQIQYEVRMSEAEMALRVSQRVLNQRGVLFSFVRKL